MEVYLLKAYIWRQGLATNKLLERRCRKVWCKIVRLPTGSSKSPFPKYSKISRVEESIEDAPLSTYDMAKEAPLSFQYIGKNKYLGAFLSGFGELDTTKMNIENSYLLLRRPQNGKSKLGESSYPQCVAVAKFERVTVAFKMYTAQLVYLDGEEVNDRITSDPVIDTGREGLEFERVRYMVYRADDQRVGKELSLSNKRNRSAKHFQILSSKVLFINRENDLVALDLYQLQQRLLEWKQGDPPADMPVSMICPQIILFYHCKEGKLVALDTDMKLIDVNRGFSKIIKCKNFDSQQRGFFKPSILRVEGNLTFIMDSSLSIKQFWDPKCIRFKVFDSRFEELDSYIFQIKEIESKENLQPIDLRLFRKQSLTFGVFALVSTVGMIVFRKGMVSIVGKPKSTGKDLITGIVPNEKNDRYLIFGPNHYSYLNLI